MSSATIINNIDMMDTQVFLIDPLHFSDEDLLPAAMILRAGGLVAFPTETVYGLGGDAFNTDAAKKIYAAKGRPSDNPLIVHVANRAMLSDVALGVDSRARLLMEAFWPGPLTLIFPKKEAVPETTTGGLSTVAVRMPDHPIALSLLRLSGVPVAAPSANTSGRPSPTCAAHVRRDLSGKIDAVVDGGAVGIGIESTILDLTQDPAVILRPGAVTRGMISRVIGTVKTDPALSFSGDFPDADTDADIPRAPGMKYRHYAPRGELTVVEGPADAVADKINALTVASAAKGKSVAVLCTVETAKAYTCRTVIPVGSQKEPGSLARGLYSALRCADSYGAQVIYAESFADDRMGEALMNRLYKAAGYRRMIVPEKRGESKE